MLTMLLLIAMVLFSGPLALILTVAAVLATINTSKRFGDDVEPYKR